MIQIPLPNQMIPITRTNVNYFTFISRGGGEIYANCEY